MSAHSAFQLTASQVVNLSLSQSIDVVDDRCRNECYPILNHEKLERICW